MRYDWYMDDIGEQVDKYQSKLVEEEKDIEKLEKKIKGDEVEILRVEKRLFREMGGFKLILDGISRYEAKFLRTGFVRRFIKHKVIYALTLAAATILVWRGVWELADQTPGLSQPIISIMAGIGLLVLVDRLSSLR